MKRRLEPPPNETVCDRDFWPPPTRWNECVPSRGNAVETASFDVRFEACHPKLVGSKEPFRRRFGASSTHGTRIWMPTENDRLVVDWPSATKTKRCEYVPCCTF